LKKIGGLSFGSKLEAAHADEASHMYFGNGVAEPFCELLATHPPLAERILAVDPAWDGKFAVVSQAETGGADQRAGPTVRPGLPAGPGERAPIPFPFPFPIPGAPQARAGLAGLAPPVITAQAVLPNLGTPSTIHLHYAVKLRASFSPALQDAARDPLGASALIYGLAISSEPEMRNQQLQLLAENTSDAIRRETELLLPGVSEMATHAKLPLVDLALPGLRHFSPAQYEQFSSAIQKLIECDGEIDLFEYVLQKVVLRHLDPQFKGARKPVLQYYAIRPLAADCAVLLSAMAHAGADDPVQAETAFRQGAQLLSRQAQAQLDFIPEDQCDLPQVDEALNRLSQAVPQIKKNVLGACALTVAADGVIQETEAELLRAIADTLDCPIPPFVQPKEEPAPAAA
jgi:hypothetical protein